MNRRFLVPTAALFLVALSGCSLDSLPFMEKRVKLPAEPAPAAQKNEYVINLSPTKVKRMGMMTFKKDALGNSSFVEPRPEALVKGEFSLLGDDVSLYLPAYGPYSVTSAKSHQFDNTSTRISVDSNKNHEIDSTENWWTSLPVRLGDQMFDIKRIDQGGTWILLAKSSAPLAGAVLGKPCPPFSFTMTNGKPVTQDDFKGRSVLLDVWSMT